MPEIPDRWFNYSCHGKVLANRFIALKVPLSRAKIVLNKDRFTPNDVLQNLPIGLIVDLTNTSRYYDPSEFTSKGVKYTKIFVPGHVLPTWDIIQRFIRTVNDYFQHAEDGKLIGVHCTHGLNRTGYLVCAYMILELGYHPQDAICLFNAKRGHRMERKNYLDSLHGMYRQESNRGHRPSRNVDCGRWDPSTRRIVHHHHQTLRPSFNRSYKQAKHSRFE